MNAHRWFRPEILELPSYVAGKTATVNDVVKLSSNENPFPLLPSVQAVLADAACNINRYPDMASGELIAEIARFHEWMDDGIVVGNGSTTLIEKLLQAVVTPGAEVVIPWRSFEAYPIAVQAAGGFSVKVPLTCEGAHDLSRMRDAITQRTRAVVLCSPNNPTGVALQHDELAAFLSHVPESIPVLLDEAYIDFAHPLGRVRSLDLLREHPNMIVLRTFSKSYGLAGLRAGYALAHPDMASGLRAISTPFGLNLLAQRAARAALRSYEEVRRRCALIVEEREKFVGALAAKGVRVPDSQANFVWLPGYGESLERECAAQGVLVRRLGEDGVRVSIGESEGLLRVLRALSAVSA